MRNLRIGRGYTISQITALTGVSRSTLRYWESIFPGIIAPERTTGGQRRYTDGDVQRIRRVDFLVNQRKLHQEGVRAAFASTAPTEDDVAWIRQEIERLAGEMSRLSETLTRPDLARAEA